MAHPKDRITPNSWNADIIRDTLPKRPAEHLVASAGHFGFPATCTDELAKIAPESVPGVRL